MSWNPSDFAALELSWNELRRPIGLKHYVRREDCCRAGGDTNWWRTKTVLNTLLLELFSKTFVAAESKCPEKKISELSEKVSFSAIDPLRAVGHLFVFLCQPNCNNGDTDRSKACHICNMTFTCPIVAESHYQGKVHAKNLRLKTVGVQIPGQYRDVNLWSRQFSVSQYFFLWISIKLNVIFI